MYSPVSVSMRMRVPISTKMGTLISAPVSSFAAFIMCNAYDQLRMSVAFPRLDVKVVGTHVGISIGEDGPSQMGIEDVNLACSLPNFTVVVPADEPSMSKAVEALGKLRAPAAANPSAIPRLMPLVPPATKTVVPLKSTSTRATADLLLVSKHQRVPARHYARFRGESSCRGDENVAVFRARTTSARVS